MILFLYAHIDTTPNRYFSDERQTIMMGQDFLTWQGRK